jgi:hypothetical protein
MDALNYQQNAIDTPGNHNVENEDDPTKCMICLEKMDNANSVTLECKHTFHLACVATSYRCQQHAVRQCFYCRSPFNEPPYTGAGLFIKGLHQPKSLKALLEKQVPHNEINWSTLSSESVFWIQRGLNGMQTGTYVRQTPKQIYLKLVDGRIVRSVSHNVSLIKV